MMVALATSQARLFGKVSKPSIDASNSPNCTSSYQHQNAAPAKRKRDELGLEQDKEATSLDAPSCKKLRPLLKDSKIPASRPSTSKPSALPQTPTSAVKSSRTGQETICLVIRNLSQPLRTLITLHKFFLKALSIHYAHNGPLAPAELSRLLETITRLWKKRSVTGEDIQRMLAVCEISPKTPLKENVETELTTSPFKLMVVGTVTRVDFAGERKEVGGFMSCPFDEKTLHESYRAHVYALESAYATKLSPHLSFLHSDSFDMFPKLAYAIGTQSAARKAHVSQQRAEILSLSNAAHLRQATALSSAAEDLSDATSLIGNRKQNLLDRIKAKQLASKTSSKPTPLQILRKHALGRVEEVVEILRMMQRRHEVGDKHKSDVDFTQSAGVVNSNSVGKVSFSLPQVRSIIKDSVRVPIADDEVNMCLKMLSDGLEGRWIKMLKGRGRSNAIFVLLEGEGVTGQEARSLLVA